MDDIDIKIEDLSCVQYNSESAQHEPDSISVDKHKGNEIKVVSPEMLMPVREAGKRKKNVKTVQIKKKTNEPILSFHARRKLIPLLEKKYVLGNPDLKVPLTLQLNYLANQADKVVEYIECQANKAEQNAEQDNNNKSYDRITNWIKFLDEKNLKDICGNELPMLFKLIGNLETHPKPEEIDGINLQELYTFLSAIMLGCPAKTPTGMTGQFLQNTFKSIISEMEDEDTRPILEQLNKSTLIAGPEVVEDFNLEGLRLILSNSSTNPFNFNFDFLNSNDYKNKFGQLESNK